jgi:hypothetical protein
LPNKDAPNVDAKGQEEHHHRTTFADENRKLLNEAGIEFDERYML